MSLISDPLDETPDSAVHVLVQCVRVEHFIKKRVIPCQAFQFGRVPMPINWELGLALKNSWELGLLSEI